MKKLLLLIVIVALALGAWIWLGGLDRVTEGRVRTALAEAGIPEALAQCMAPRMVDRLSIVQLRKLERIGAQDGEYPVPLSTTEALARIRRVDDREAIEVTAAAAGRCALQGVLDGI